MKQIQKGFTLIELMIVVAIIGILAAVAIPAYQDYVTKAKLSKVSSTLDPLKMALSMYQQENGAFPAVAAGAEVATAANANAVLGAGSVWGSIGLAKTPTVPAELASIEYNATNANPQVVNLVLTFAAAGVGTGVNGLVLTERATVGGTGITWTCETATAGATTLATTGSGAVARKYFGCI